MLRTAYTPRLDFVCGDTLRVDRADLVDVMTTWLDRGHHGVFFADFESDFVGRALR